jgi:hypothetical protein
MGLRLVVDGEIGVEVEVEGNPNTNFVDNRWVCTKDGSLRGLGSREFVLNKPQSEDEAIKSVCDLYTQITSNQGMIDDSMRAGVHVHLNFSKNTIKEVLTFLALYYSFEIILTNRFGPDRVGNLFCLRVVDAEYTSESILQAINTNNYRSWFKTDNIRYSACNLAALPKYGSIEFRALKTPLTPQPIVEWIQILSRLKTLSKNFKDPAEVLTVFSAGGDKEIIEIILGKEEAEKTVNLPSYNDDLLEGIRAIQFWAFSKKWDEI